MHNLGNYYISSPEDDLFSKLDEITEDLEDLDEIVNGPDEYEDPDGELTGLIEEYLDQASPFINRARGILADD